MEGWDFASGGSGGGCPSPLYPCAHPPLKVIGAIGLRRADPLENDMDSRISFDQLPEAVLMVHEPVSGLPQLPGTAAAGSIDRECGPNVPFNMLRPVKGHRYRYSAKDSRK